MTKYCVRCGKPAKFACGHVLKDSKNIIAGWCSKRCAKTPGFSGHWLPFMSWIKIQAELAQCREELRVSERALHGKGYRKSCDIPACNCGDQWNHGGHADTRLMEISDALPYVNGKTILTRVQDIVDDLAQATQREARLWELLRQAVQCFCVTQKPADYPVDSWINKALTELRRPEEAGT